jgi:hypothetical protein
MPSTPAAPRGTPAALSGDLIQLVGKDQVLHRISDLVRYASDASAYRYLPQVPLVSGPEVDRSGGWQAAIALAEKLRGTVYGARCWTAPPSRRTTRCSAGRSGCR